MCKIDNINSQILKNVVTFSPPNTKIYYMLWNLNCRVLSNK